MPHMIRINDSLLHQRLKAHAAIEGRTVVDVVESALNRYLTAADAEVKDVAALMNATPGVVMTRRGKRRVKPAFTPAPKPQTRIPALAKRLEEAGFKPLDPTLADVCKRCKHQKGRHYGTGKITQPKCNVAGCACARFL